MQDSFLLYTDYMQIHFPQKELPETFFEHQYNSPWNIAAKFKIDMSFSTNQIAAMLAEYEADCAVNFIYH